MDPTTPDSEQATPPRTCAAHRAPAIKLPADPQLSAALVLRYVQTGETAFDRSAALEAMVDRVSRLSAPDADAETLLKELAGHAAVLDALFQHWTVQAINAKGPEHKGIFMRLALGTQGTYTRTLIALQGLKQQLKGQARLIPNRDSGDSSDGEDSGAVFESDQV